MNEEYYSCSMLRDFNPIVYNVSNFSTPERNKNITNSTELAYSLQIAVPGLGIEDITAKVKGDLITIEIPESDFTVKETFTRQVVFPFTKDSVSVDLESGILVLIITKPEDYEYEVDIQK